MPSMKCTFSIVSFLLFSSEANLLAINSSGGYFTTPPPQGANDVFSDNPVYYLGENIEIQWVTNMEVFTLLLWQIQGLDEEQYESAVLLINQSGATSFSWVVELTYNNITFNQTKDPSIPYRNVFGLAMYNYSDYPTFKSHQFNISANSSTSSASTASSTATVTSGPNSNLQSDSPLANFTTSQQAGIGVGIGLAGTLAVVALMWAIFFQKRSRRNTDQEVLREVPAEEHLPSSSPSPNDPATAIVAEGPASKSEPLIKPELDEQKRKRSSELP